MDRNLTREMFHDAANLSVDIINHLKDIAPDKANKIYLLALAITYSTLSKGLDVNLHQAMELIMTIYKNTEIIKDE